MKFFLLILVGFFGACSLVHDKEVPAPTRKTSMGKKACDFDGWDSLADGTKITEAQTTAALDCFDTQVDLAFEKLKGKYPDELSIDEIRILDNRKVFDIDWSTRSKIQEKHWTLLHEFAGMLHPLGRPAFSKARLKQISAWARSKAKLYVDLIRCRDANEGSYAKCDQYLKVVEATDEFIDFISPAYRMNVEKAEKLALDWDTHLNPASLEPWQVPRTKKDTVESVQAAWALKSAILPDFEGLGAGSDLTGQSVIELLRLLVRVARYTDTDRQWGAKSLSPPSLPKKWSEDFVSAMGEIKTYFATQPFAPIDTKLFAWSVEKLAPMEGLADFAPDLVRISQRLAPNKKIYSGFHPAFLSTILDAATPFSSDIVVASVAFPVCEVESSKCGIPISRALKNPSLASIALKTPPFSGDFLKPMGPKKTDWNITWAQSTRQLAFKNIVGELFQAFDSDGDGKIPYAGDPDKEFKDSLDLAYAFLRFVGFSSSGSERARDKEERIPVIPAIKPSVVYSLLGAIGDKWYPDGNSDGSLNSEEFFGALEMFEQIQAASSFASAGVTPAFTSPENSAGNNQFYDFSIKFYPRKAFVSKLSIGLKAYRPYLNPIVEALPETTRNSLFHSLVAYSPNRSRKVIDFGFGEGNKERTLTDYATPADALPVAAMVTALDQVMVMCDANQDGDLDWKEMDCGVPLMLGAGDQIMKSGLLELEPGVNDLVRVALPFLMKEGLPLTIAKLILANGGVDKFRLEGFNWDAFLKTEIPAGLKPYPMSEAESDFWKRIKVWESMITGSEDPRFATLAQSLITMWNHPKLTQQLLSGLPFKTNPQKILATLEQIIRRKLPLESTMDPMPAATQMFK